MSNKISWKQAFTSTGWKWKVAAISLMGALSWYKKEPVGMYFILAVAVFYLLAVYGTRKQWNGFV